MATDTRKANTQNLLRQAVTSCARDIAFQITKAFEEMGCSCHPLRKEQEQLIDECRRLQQQVDDECNRLKEELRSSETFKRRDAVSQEIQTIDRKEHPSLDTQARAASPFFRVWLYERLNSEDAPDLSSPENLATNYAEAWLGGWRPKGG